MLVLTINDTVERVIRITSINKLILITKLDLLDTVVGSGNEDPCQTDLVDQSDLDPHCENLPKQQIE